MCHNNMWRLSVLVILALTSISKQVSTKVDFGEEEIPSDVKVTSNNNEDVEVQHTIVVSTKLKNQNNRRGLHSEDGAGFLTYNVDNKNVNKDDSGEVPIVKAYKSVETTQIRTPDTRLKHTSSYPEITQNRNSRDEYDFYPNLATNPLQWKPSSFFNNINWWSQDGANLNSRNRPDYPKLNRRVSDDGVRDFYCRKCREMTGYRGCGQGRRNSWLQESTTPKIKVDGKLAKLN